MIAQNGHDECIRCLVDECGVDVDSPKADGASTMFIAAQNGNASSIRVPAELGGKVDRDLKLCNHSDATAERSVTPGFPSV